VKIQDYYDKAANECKICNGKKLTVTDGKSVICLCQRMALARYRWEEIPINGVYRSLDWKHFGNTGKLVLPKHVYESARASVLGYCFTTASIGELKNYQAKPESLKKIENLTFRVEVSKLVERCKNGENVAIFGDEQSGKTFLASLITREAIHTSAFKKEMQIEWVPFYRIAAKLEWGKIDQEFVDDLSYFCDFLIIDDVHNTSKTYNPVSLDNIIGTRSSNDKATILTIRTGTSLKMLGNEILKLVNSPKTLRVFLTQESHD